MADALNVGLDLGSTGLRAAYLADGPVPALFDDPMATPSTWLRCVPAPASRLGVAFPSIKNELTTAPMNVGNRPTVEPSKAVAAALRRVRESISQRVSRPLGQAVISVPAGYSSSQRTILRQAALDAGFQDAHLISDSVAAVIAHFAAGERSSTALVCSIGYSGFELGLVRAARGHYRALAYETGTAPSGSSLDLLLLESVFTLASEHGVVIDTRGWDAALWLQVRAEAQRTKEELSTRQRADFSVIQTADGQIVGRVQFQQRDFEKPVRQMFSTMLDRTQNLLEQANMTLSDVDTLLLVGGTMRIPAIQSLMQERLGTRPVLLAPEDLVLGAAFHAARLDARPVVAAAEERPADASAGEAVPTASILRAEIAVTDASTGRGDGGQFVLLARPLDGPATSSIPEPADPLAYARNLLAQGRSDEARNVLERLVTEATTLLAAIPPTPAPAPAPHPSGMGGRARRTLMRAEQLLASGHFEQAVQTSHAAWRESPDNPDAFERMLDVHCRAAAAATDPSRYADAQRWLLCACSHDASNVRIRTQLAERHYLQAKHLFESGKRADAARTLERCFSIDPDHVQAGELRQLVTRR